MLRVQDQRDGLRMIDDERMSCEGGNCLTWLAYLGLRWEAVRLETKIEGAVI